MNLHGQLEGQHGGLAADAGIRIPAAAPGVTGTAAVPDDRAMGDAGGRVAVGADHGAERDSGYLQGRPGEVPGGSGEAGAGGVVIVGAACAIFAGTRYRGIRCDRLAASRGLDGGQASPDSFDDSAGEIAPAGRFGRGAVI